MESRIRVTIPVMESRVHSPVDALLSTKPGAAGRYRDAPPIANTATARPRDRRTILDEPGMCMVSYWLQIERPVDVKAKLPVEVSEGKAHILYLNVWMRSRVLPISSTAWWYIGPLSMWIATGYRITRKFV